MRCCRENIVTLLTHQTVNGGAGNFNLGVYRGSGPPVRSNAEAPVEGLGDKFPQKLKQFADIVYRF